MSTTIEFYKVGLEKNSLQNPSNLTNNPYTQSGNIFDPLNVVNPIVEVNVANVEQYNLIKIPVNNRYYWINDYEYIAEGNVCNLHCESAPLITWYDAIVQSRAIIKNSTGYYNKNLINNEFPILDQKLFTVDKFPKSLKHKDVFILTTLGGGN